MQVQHCALRGRQHLRTGLPCQDRVHSREENGVVSLALADGAGSVSHSQEGASLAVKSICQILCQQFDDLHQAPSPGAVKLAILPTLWEKLDERAKELEVPRKQLACTLLAVAMRGDRYLLFHVGDGVIAYQKAGKLHVASAPHNGEFANTTTFLTSPNCAQATRVLRGTQEAIEAFVLMSDGSEATFYRRSKGVLSPQLSQVLACTHYFAPQSAEAYVEAVVQGICLPRTGDDCSLALLTRDGVGFPHWAHMTPREKARLLGIKTQKASRRRHQIAKYARAYGIVNCTKGDDATMDHETSIAFA